MYPANAGRSAEEGTRSGRSPGPRHALAGLQAGVLGALFLIVCLMGGSLWNGRSVWVVPNLFATTFFGSAVYSNRLLRTSWTGVALIVVLYGGLGILWGCIWRDRRQRWLRLYGAIAGLAVYLLLRLLWLHVNPLVALYAPDRQLELGSVLWGMALAGSPSYARRIADSTSHSINEQDTPMATPDTNQTDTTQPGVYDAAADEIRSGEVIR